MLEEKKVWLNEVSFMRPILLVLLVSYHAFAPYCGAWTMPEGIKHIEFYKWVALFSRAFRLEAFVFISGYIFTFQLLTKNKFNGVWEVVLNKANRLLLPCVFFGIIYYLMFRNCSQISPLNILTGIGHLWYLPCLFWLFIIQYLLISNNKSKYVIGGVICLLPILSVLPIPLQLNKACYFLMFFYGGGLFYQYKDTVAKRTTAPNTILLWVVFAVMVFAVNLIMEYVQGIVSTRPSIAIKAVGYSSSLYMKIALAWVGILSLYQTAVLYCRRHRIGSFLLKVGVCGYGVYIFHQFVLIHLYRQTSLPQILGSYWLPWVSLLFATTVSVLLTLFIRQTRLGKKYL